MLKKIYLVGSAFGSHTVPTALHSHSLFHNFHLFAFTHLPQSTNFALCGLNVGFLFSIINPLFGTQSIFFTDYTTNPPSFLSIRYLSGIFIFAKPDLLLFCMDSGGQSGHHIRRQLEPKVSEPSLPFRHFLHISAFFLYKTLGHFYSTPKN